MAFAHMITAIIPIVLVIGSCAVLDDVIDVKTLTNKRSGCGSRLSVMRRTGIMHSYLPPLECIYDAPI